MAVIGNAPFQGLVSGGEILDASIEGVDLSTSAIAARLGYTPVDPANASLVDTGFFIVDAADTTKKATFDGASITTATTRTYTLPDASGTIALLSGTQIFTSATTFSTTTGTLNLGTSMSTGLLTIGGINGTGNLVLGRSTATQTTSIQAGATASGSTKTINFGTGGLSGSTTAISIGSAVSGATSTTTLNGTVNLAGGTANGIAYLNGSNVLTSGSALTFNGTTLTATDITDSSLTANRVIYAGTGGNLVDSANLTFNSQNFVLTNTAAATPISGTYALSVNGNLNITAALGGTGEAYVINTQSTKNQYYQAGTMIVVNAVSPATPINSAALMDFNAYNSAGGASNVFIGAVAGNTNAAASFVIGRRTGTNNWAESLRVDTSGNLGIGTNNPAYRLQVAAADSNIAEFTSSGAATAVRINNTNANGWGGNLAFYSNGTGAGFVGTVGSLIGSTAQDITLWATAGNGVRFYTNGNNERARITTSGNFGIGTTDPQEKLHVQGKMRLFDGGYPYLDLGVSTSNYFRFIHDNPNDRLIIGKNSATAMVVDGSNFVHFYAQGTAGAGTINLTSADPFIRFTASGGTADKQKWDIRAIGSTGSEALEFRTINDANTVFSTKLWVSHAGSVGVGTTSPSAQLHVRNANGNSGMGGNDNSGMAQVESTYAGGGASANASFLAKNYYGYSQFMQWENYGLRIGNRGITNGGNGGVTFTYGNDNIGMFINGSTGNLGVGTTIPGYKTTIYQNASNTDVLTIHNNQINGDSALRFVGMSFQDDYGNGTGNASAIRSYSNLYSSWGSKLTFWTTASDGNNLTERARIDQNGNFGIGTLSPIARLHVNSTASALVARFDTTQSGGAIAGFFQSSSPIGYIGANGPWLGTSASNMMIAAEGGKAVLFYTNGSATERARIAVNGNFCIGTTNDAYKLNVVSSGSAGLAVTTSGATTGSPTQDWYDASNGSEATLTCLNGAVQFGSYSASPLLIATNNTERVRIGTSGGMSVGTTTAAPASGLRVGGATNPAGGIISSNLIAGYVIGNYSGTRYWVLHRMQTGAGVEQSAFNCMGDIHASSYTTWNLCNLWIRREYASTNVFAGITGVIKNSVTVSVVDITYSNVRYVAIKFAGGDPGIEANLVGYLMDQMYSNGTDPFFINGTAGVSEIAVIASY
jgi:hypothetical protein